MPIMLCGKYEWGEERAGQVLSREGVGGQRLGGRAREREGGGGKGTRMGGWRRRKGGREGERGRKDGLHVHIPDDQH